MRKYAYIVLFVILLLSSCTYTFYTDPSENPIPTGEYPVLGGTVIVDIQNLPTQEKPTATPTNTPEPTQSICTGAAVENVNVRSGPGTQYDRIGLFEVGEIVKFEYITNTNWAKFLDGEAYVFAEYVTFSGDCPVLTLYTPTPEVGTPIPTETEPSKVFCPLKPSLYPVTNVRSGPGVTFSIVNKAQQGMTLEIDEFVRDSNYMWGHSRTAPEGWLVVWSETVGWWADTWGNNENCVDVLGYPNDFGLPPATIVKKRPFVLGVHNLPTANTQLVLEILDVFPSQKAVSNYPLLFNVKQRDPNSLIIFREWMDCPDSSYAYEDWFYAHKAVWDTHPIKADYYEYVNECRVTRDPEFAITAMRLANQSGYCLLNFSFAGGNPEQDEWVDLMPAFLYAINHPCGVWEDGSPKYHGIAAHAYRLDEKLSLEDPYVNFRLPSYLCPLTPGICETLPIVYTEWGGSYTDEFAPVNCGQMVLDARWAIRVYTNSPYNIIAINWWSNGGGTGWRNIEHCLMYVSNELR